MQFAHQNKFIVYKSSAGSGKTFTLVKEYLKLALADKHQLKKAYREILAITFTNKAASEMKWRIIKALKEISSSKNEFLSNLLAKELSVSNDDLKERSALVLTDILHNYSDFSIGTIDSFTHRIIRTFALDLKLPINFQIETDSDAVFKKVISALINNLGKDKLITDYLVQFSLSQVEENKNWDPELILVNFIKEINKEGVGDLVAKINQYTISDFEEIKKQLKIFIKKYETFLKEHGEKALKIISQKQLAPSAFASGGSGIYNLFVKLALLKETSEAELFNSNVNKTLLEDKWYGGKASVSEKQIVDSIKLELKTIADDVLRFLQENEPRYKMLSLIYKNIYAIGLVNELAKLTEQYKSEENILFISEFNERISDVVNNEPTPFIFERLGDRYKHFLLDEFQDTSAMQWQNMLPLIDNSLGNANFNLIVGDGKQSIYRWRNADVEQFVNLPAVKLANKNELVVEREDSLIRNFEGRVLDQNFRSQSAIVKFNNALFQFLSETVLTDNLKKIYDKQEQKHKPEELGYVSINFPELGDDEKDEVNLKLVLQYVQMAIADGYSYKDICVIIRVNKHGDLVANCLIENNIPVVSADSLLLNHATEITVVLSFLKYISNQKDSVSASVVINYLYQKGFCNQEQYVVFLREVNSHSGKTLFNVLNQCGLTADVVKITASNLFDCCVEIITSLQLDKSNPQYIRFFVDEVLGFLQANTSNISLFLDWWERRGDTASVIIPEGMNAVNIMTIHSSKGLEFPVVITPFIAWDIEKEQSIWVELNEEEVNLPVALIRTTKAADDTIFKPLAEKERQQQTLDSLNLLYVDFTRAVDRLHIISPKLKKNVTNNCHTWLMNFAKAQSTFNEDEQLFELGTISPKISAHHAVGLQQLRIPSLSFNQNNDVVQIKGASAYNSNEELEKARDYGVLMHYILAKIKTKKDVELVVEQAKQAGDINTHEAKKMLADINSIMSLKSISAYFEENISIKNEMEILTESGHVLRPDRVVIDGSKAIVIDYKTGKKNASKYHAQMHAYQNALFGLGYKSVTKILLYIHEQEVEILD